ncbi:MAG: hypothetical protein ACAI34_24300, partial [Verrucomicrobium sp.]
NVPGRHGTLLSHDLGRRGAWHLGGVPAAGLARSGQGQDEHGGEGVTGKTLGASFEHGRCISMHGEL